MIKESFTDFALCNYTALFLFLLFAIIILGEDRIIFSKLLLETIMAIVQVFFRGLLFRWLCFSSSQVHNILQITVRYKYFLRPS